MLSNSSWSQSQDNDISMYIFGHSLIHHEFQIFETPSQETSVPHWLYFLAEEADHNYKVSGQYGFLLNHANLPPSSQWGFDFVQAAWDSESETFAEAAFSHILLTPANFIQWQSPESNYVNEDSSPVDATNSILNWCHQQSENLNFHIYENWPDMAPFLSNDFPPTMSEWVNYNIHLENEFSPWFDEYYELIKNSHPDKCVKMIPVGRLISKALLMPPFNQIDVSDLYEDNAPHGRPSIYFMAAMITYMATNQEMPPNSYQPTGFISPIIAENYEILNQFLWNELAAFNEPDGTSKVFCPSSTTTQDPMVESSISINPNPSTDFIIVNSKVENLQLSIYDTNGKLVSTIQIIHNDQKIDISFLQPGIYYIKGTNKLSNQFQKLIKL